MSRVDLSPDHKPLIVLVHRANRVLQAAMTARAQRLGYPDAKPAHNAVFGTLSFAGDRASDMAQRAGITRQSMGEVVRELVGLGVLELRPDPTDRRAKLVVYTEEGRRQARLGFDFLTRLESMFIEEFGEEDYATARRVLERVATIMEDPPDHAD